MTSLDRRLAEFFAKRPPSPGVIAISGGADSVALAFLAQFLLAGRASDGVTNPSLARPANDRPIILAHLNHQLRGAESDADEAFVIDLAHRWRLPVETARINVAARAVGHNLEQTARETRYEWLTQIARRHRATWIATAHTADDQAETVLHHFLRGTGLTGLSGIAEELPLPGGIALLRPLLNVRRQELVSLLNQEKIAYRVDSSNLDRAFTRNRLRHEVIPLLESSINPALIDVLTRTATQAQECQTAVTRIAQNWLERTEKPRANEMLIFDRTMLASLEPFWIREMFRLVWKREDWPMGEMNADDWRRLEKLVDGSLPRHDFPGAVHVRSQRHVVQLWRTCRVG